MALVLAEHHGRHARPGRLSMGAPCASARGTPVPCPPSVVPQHYVSRLALRLGKPGDVALRPLLHLELPGDVREQIGDHGPRLPSRASRAPRMPGVSPAQARCQAWEWYPSFWRAPGSSLLPFAPGCSEQRRVRRFMDPAPNRRWPWKLVRNSRNLSLGPDVIGNAGGHRRRALRDHVAILDRSAGRGVPDTPPPIARSSRDQSRLRGDRLDRTRNRRSLIADGFASPSRSFSARIRAPGDEECLPAAAPDGEFVCIWGTRFGNTVEFG